MKKVLLATCCLVLCGGLVFAQEARTERIQYGENQADIQLKQIDEKQVEFSITNPNGPEKASVRIKDRGNGEFELTSHDENTGKILTHTTAIKNQKLDSVAQMPNGNYHEIHINKTGSGKEDIDASVKAKSTDYEIDMQINKGIPVGSFSQVNNGYRQKISMFANGNVEIEITEEKTKKLIFTALGDARNVKVYDANKKLIAEGNEDNPTIYDQKAWDEFKRITGDDED